MKTEGNKVRHTGIAFVIAGIVVGISVGLTLICRLTVTKRIENYSFGFEAGTVGSGEKPIENVLRSIDICVV